MSVTTTEEPNKSTSTEAIQKLSRDLRAAAKLLSPREARYFVGAYYDLQDYRIAAANQQRKLQAGEEPSEFMEWFNHNLATLENQIRAMLDKWSGAQAMGVWARCAPPEARVTITSGRWGGSYQTMPIEGLRDGDGVVSFDRKHARMTHPIPVTTSRTEYSGHLIQVATDAHQTRVTPDHKWLIRLTCSQDAEIVYLMRQGFRFRVGRCQAASRETDRKNGRLRLRARSRQEKADQVWILKFCQSRRDASLYESLIAAQYGLPVMPFEQTSGGGGPVKYFTKQFIDEFFSQLEPDSQLNRALRCLMAHGLSMNQPLLADIGYGKKESVQGFVLTAANLIPGMMDIPIPKRNGGMEWRPVQAVNRIPYEGPVYSLDVPDHHKYIQDGLVTCNSIVGIGPVIASGLLANIDIEKAPTVGHIWRFAGLDPTVKWNRHEKRPWNASLKRLCWLMGESFVKVSGNERDIYGKLYRQRKDYEAGRNDRGELAPFARLRLEQDKGKKLDPELRAIFETGKLPQIALHERAKRWAVKQFLSDWHAEAYRLHFHTSPPAPYPLARLGHAHKR